jgi:hypothetical protein
MQKEAMVMELTYESLSKWFDVYFEDVNKNQGSIELVANLKKYFSADFEFWMYTAPSFFTPPLTRDGLLMLFVHPGLHEALVPQYYVVDVKWMIVVVQFEIRFVDEISGTTFPPKQASAHYHLVLDEKGDLKIKKIQYWTQSSPPDAMAPMYKAWNDYKQKALVDLAMKYINSKP